MNPVTLGHADNCDIVLDDAGDPMPIPGDAAPIVLDLALFMDRLFRSEMEAEDAALAIRDSGTTIVGVNSYGAIDLASSDEDVVETAAAHRRMVRYAPPEVLATQIADRLEERVEVIKKRLHQFRKMPLDIFYHNS